MRITNSMIMTTQNRGINQNLIKYQQVSEQLYSGKLINKPSQNPYFTTKIMDYKAEISTKEQYQRNIEHVSSWMDAADSALGNVNSALLRIKELTTKASNSSNNQDDLDAIATELDEIMETIADQLNTNLNGNYIFGKPDGDKPFSTDGNYNYSEATDLVAIEIEKGININKNIEGEKIIGKNPDMFESLKNLSEAIRNGLDNKDEIQKYASEVEGHSNNILSVRTQVGATQNRLDVTLEKNKDEVLTIKKMLSNIEDVDYAEKIIELESISAMYSASLQVSAKMMEQSLLNFLR